MTDDELDEYGYSPRQRNRLRELMEAARLMEELDALEAAPAGQPGMPAPREDIAPLAEGYMRFESGPRAGEEVRIAPEPIEGARHPPQPKLGARVQGRTGKMGRYSEDQRSIVHGDGSVEDLFPKDTAKKLGQWFEMARRGQTLKQGELTWQRLAEQIESSRAERAAKEAERSGPAWLEKFYGKAPEGMRWTMNGELQAIPGYENGKLTEAQGKAMTFGSRATASNEVLEAVGQGGRVQPNLLKRGVEGVPLVGGALGMIANKLPDFGPIGGPSAAQQQVEQAERDFINAVLRRESGAVISDAEFDNARRQYFPQPGDTPEVVEQKRRNRGIVVRSLGHEAGPAKKRVFDEQARARAIMKAKQAMEQGAPAGKVRARLEANGIMDHGL